MKRTCQHPGCPDGAVDQFCSKHSTQARPSVTLICGPPASGKTTYVNQRKQHDEIVVDLDPIKNALAGTDWYEASDLVVPYALAARNGIVQELQRPNLDVRHAWMIGMYPQQHQRQEFRDILNADVIVLEVSEAECMRRIEADERRINRPMDMWQSLIREWWQIYERDSRDDIIKD